MQIRQWPEIKNESILKNIIKTNIQVATHVINQKICTMMILPMMESTKNDCGLLIHWRNPKRTLIAPAKNVPPKKSFRDPINWMYLPKTGENTMVVTKAEP